jgi:hypothetical protein
MRVKNLDIGVDAISRWTVSDETHLPRAERFAPAYMPQESLLDEILTRPNLEERLTRLMQPQTLDLDLLEAAVLGQVRRDLRNLFREEAAKRNGRQRRILASADKTLADDIELDEAVGEAIAALFRA